MKNFAAVIFDLDGTLLDTLADLANSVNRVLIAEGYPPHPLEAYKYFIGNGARKLMERAMPKEKRNDENINKCLLFFNNDYKKNWNVESRPYEGVPEMLDALMKTDIKLAVLSNKPHKFTRLCVGELLSPWKFQVILGARDSVPRKPDPAGALEVAELLQVKPSSCLYLGDTDTDMQTAVNAGMYPAGALWGFRTEEELLKNGAKALLKHPGELIGLI